MCLVAIQQPERDITALDLIPTNQTLERNTLAKKPTMKKRSNEFRRTLAASKIGMKGNTREEAKARP
jgi:hypothetical protein